MSKYYIFSNVQTCPPCRFMVDHLNAECPGWKEKVEYVDLTKGITTEQEALLTKHSVRSIPAIVNNEEHLGVGFSKIVGLVMELC